MARKDIKETIKYNNAWTAENRERISLIVDKGMKAEIKKAAEENGESVNQFIVKSIKERMSK